MLDGGNVKSAADKAPGTVGIKATSDSKRRKPVLRTFGKAVLSDGEWHVSAEPHVMLRLRRVFARGGTQLGTIKLKDTEEICRDLSWFITRFRLKVEPASYLKKRAKEYDDRTAQYEAIISGQIDPKPINLAIPLRKYQTVAADLTLRARGLLVADDVGLGKTAIGIALLADPENRPALVVTLTHLPAQWEREIEKFAPDLTTHIIKKGSPYNVNRKKGRKKKDNSDRQLELNLADFPDVLIINYHKLAGWAETLAPIIKTVIYDEAQELRRRGSNKSRAASHMSENASLRCALTATPIYNYGGEMFNVIDKLRPGELGTVTEFMREWCDGNDFDKARVKDPKAFGTYLREQGLMIRRTREEVGRELLPITKIPHYVQADEKALDAVSDDIAELAKIILSESTKRFDRMRAGGELDWKLRQATGIAKAPFVAEFVRFLVENGEKVVLYSWHRAVYDIYMDRLDSYYPAMYTGSESPKQKQDSYDRFVKNETDILIMSLRAGAGLDGLQGHSNIVVFGELDWSPGVHEQNEGRLWRDGQETPVSAYYLISDSGSDPIIADTLGLKKAQIEGVRDPNKNLIEGLSKDVHSIRKLAEDFLKKRGEIKE